MRSDVRTPAIAIGGTVLLFVLLAVLLPDGIPPGLFLTAATVGLLQMLTTAGLVLIYRSSRVVNFAQIGLGAAGAALFYELTTRGILPYAVALPAGILSGSLLGLIVGGIIAMLFFQSPRLVLTIVTIIVAGVLFQLQASINNVFRPEDEVSSIQPVCGPFCDWTISISGFPFRAGHIIAAVGVIATAVGLAFFLRRSRFGIAVRGTAENADRASLLGINVRMVSVLVWVVVGTLASLNSVLALPIVNYQPGRGADPAALLVPLTAAVLAGMTNLPVAMAATFVITVLRSVVFFSYPDAQFLDVILFGVILVTLLVRKAAISARVLEGASWRAQKEVRAMPSQLQKLRGLAWTRRVLLLLPVLAALGYPWISNASEQILATQIMLIAMIGISLVVLTGWSGQISLGQAALAGVGAYAEAVIAGRLGVPMWFALPLAAAAAAGFAALVGIPALRVRGLFLAVATLALAIVMPSILFLDGALGRFLPDGEVARPTLFFLDFADPRSFYYLVLLIFGAVFASARGLRKGRTGRLLIALRDDEAGTRAFGVDAVRTRLSAFVLSGGIAGLAGGLFVHLSMGLDRAAGATFGVQFSIQVFIMTIVGGISSVGGAVLGAVFFEGVPVLFQNAQQIAIILTQGLVPILILIFLPGGLLQGVFAIRDAILRVVALRNRIVVPSLFADYSPEAWERRQAPLSPAQQGRGLGVLPAGERYDLPSRLWGNGRKQDEQEAASV